MYEKGQCVRQSYSDDFHLYEMAADQNDANSQCNLGIMCKEGQGVRQNDSMAFHKHKKAAQQGHDHVQFNLPVPFLFFAFWKT